MDEHRLDIAIAKPFGNLRRERCVLLAVQDSQGNVLVGAKPDFLPPTITRLLGGGVDEGETFEHAAVRELEEELTIGVDERDLSPIVKFIILATDQDGKQYRHETAVYAVNIRDRPYQAGDDVKEIIKMSLDELHDLGRRYERISETLWYNGEEGLYSWADYGKLYGPVHKETAKRLKAND
jgi:ADP-ribose pyrophosphatase YjhB (NUDIX family)